jgi:hypothetical protein
MYMGKMASFYLDDDIIDGFNAYVEEMRKTIPEDLRETSQVRSHALRGILRGFLKEKGYITEKISPQ